MKHATKAVTLGVALVLAGTAYADPVNGNQANAANGTFAVHHIRRTQVPPGVVVDGINNDGWIFGRWTDRNGVSHIFLLNPFVSALSNIGVHDRPPTVMLDTFSG